MPREGVKLIRKEEILSFEEIVRVVGVGAKLGIERVRVTGGEPLVRRGVVGLIRQIAGIEGINACSITTNGTLLKRFAGTLKEAGVRSVNISIDTLDEEKFRRITRGGELGEVLEGLRSALRTGFEYVKVNMVLMRGINDGEIGDFVELAREQRLEVRFIEFMPSGVWREEEFLSADTVLEELKRFGKARAMEKDGGGPAEIFEIKGFLGRVGVVRAVTRPFCGGCNRLRLTADGRLRLCLLRDEEIDLKPYLREEKGTLEEAFALAVELKPKEHKRRRSNVMSAIGG